MARTMERVHDKPRRRRGLRRLAWALAGFALVIAIVEVSLRRMGYTQRAVMYFDQDIGFRSWPNQTRWQLGRDMQPTVLMRLNGEGFRGPLLDRERTEGVTRVVTLGDSYNFGLGVEDTETYPVQLERELHAAQPGAYEVMDVSYPGWAPANETAAYVHIIRDYSPDVVVLGFTFNDLQPPDAGFRYTDNWFFRWFGTSAIGWAITTKGLNKLPDFVIEPDESTQALNAKYFEDPNAVPLRAAEPIAEPFWEATMPALLELRDVTAADGVRLLVAYFPDRQQIDRLQALAAQGDVGPAERSSACQLQEELARRCTQAGIEFLDTTDALWKAQSNPFDGLEPGHPGATGYGIMARQVAEVLR